MSMPMRIILTGGGTGGHVYPALAAAAASADIAEVAGAEFLYVGTTSGLERDIVAKAGLPFEAIEAGAIRGRSPTEAAAAGVRMLRGVAQARGIIARFRPDVVLATGGFVCVPVVVAARTRGVPSVVYLPDLRPGWAVRFLARVATVIAVSFGEVVPHVPSRRVVVTGYPVRRELLRWTREEARLALRLPGNLPSVLVLGGSRGARNINEGLTAGLAALVERATVVHGTGAQHIDQMREARQRLPAHLQDRYRPYAFLDAELAPAMAAADLIVARAGASTLGELPAVGAPGLVIPGTFAGAHQRLNADFLANRGAAVVLDDDRARDGDLVLTILSLLDNQPRLASMAAAAHALARPDAAERLIRLVAEVARRPAGAPT